MQPGHHLHNVHVAAAVAATGAMGLPSGGLGLGLGSGAGGLGLSLGLGLGLGATGMGLYSGGGHSIMGGSNPGPAIQRGKEVQGPLRSNLFVFHVPNHLSTRELYQLFVPYGEIVSCRIMVERETGLSRGFGFVSFSGPAAAELAINNLNGFIIGSKRLRVSHKKEKDDDSLSPSPALPACTKATTLEELDAPQNAAATASLECSNPESTTMAPLEVADSNSAGSSVPPKLLPAAELSPLPGAMFSTPADSTVSSSAAAMPKRKRAEDSATGGNPDSGMGPSSGDSGSTCHGDPLVAATHGSGSEPVADASSCSSPGEVERGGLGSGTSV